MEFLKILTAVTGVVMSLGYYPQAYKIWKLKSAKEISLLNYVILSIGTAIWTIYGIFLRDPVIIVSFIVGVIGANLVLILSVKYK